MNKNFLRNTVTFLAVLIIVNFLLSKFITPPVAQTDNANPLTITMSKTEYGRNALVGATIKNNTDQDLVLPSNCPAQPITASVYKDSAWQPLPAVTPDIPCNETNTSLLIKSRDEVLLDLSNWNHALFGENGRYKLSLSIPDAADATKMKTVESNEFTVVNPSIFRWIWITIFYQPVYNVLIFLTTTLPMHDLGFAIILLTIIIRVILLVPSQKALKSQKKMQLLQPKLEAIKEKHKGNQQMISTETMALWKDHKVNPFGSCLPLLIQFPVLIALFNAVQTGLNPDNAYLLYNGFVSVAFSEIHTLFLGVLELTKRNAYVLPLIVGLLQFVQMKMTLKKADTGAKKSEMEMANNMMIYVMPVMIAVFTASTPAGVGLYWATSTLFGIGQQYFVNRDAEKSNMDSSKMVITV